MNGNLSYCVLVPVYNNAGTIVDVLQRALAVTEQLIVICDGCTDGTPERIAEAALPVQVLSYPKNKGKGAALRLGFSYARERGYAYAITVDADGQHFPEDIPLLLAAIEAHPGALAVGSRRLDAENMPSGNTFANRFSNFQFTVNTGVRLPDTQTGFRAWPLAELPPLWLIPSRYEAELALLDLCAWRGVPLIPVPVRVHYPPKGERISHFRPFADFSRIFILNCILFVTSLVYGWPRTLLRKIFCKK